VKIIISYKGGHGGQAKHYRRVYELIGYMILKDPKKLSWRVCTEGSFGLLKSKGFWESWFSEQFIVWKLESYRPDSFVM